jgi:hypothetical protein
LTVGCGLVPLGAELEGALHGVVHQVGSEDVASHLCDDVPWSPSIGADQALAHTVFPESGVLCTRSTVDPGHVR